MLGELWTKRRVIVCLNFLDGEGEMLADFLSTGLGPGRYFFNETRPT
jgi:hypothetical protein